MARGTKKRYFKKNKTRNNKKIRKQRRMKHSNKSRKRKQNKKSKKRKAGMFALPIKYSQLTQQQKKYLKMENIYTQEDKESNVEDFVKHHLADHDAIVRRVDAINKRAEEQGEEGDLNSEEIYRPRGYQTNRNINKRYSKNINEYNEIMKNNYEEKKRINTIKKAEAEAAAIEEAKAELKKTVDNAMKKLKSKNKDEHKDEEKTIETIQKAIDKAQSKGIKDEDDAMKYAEKHLDDVYRQLEKFNIEHDRKVQEERNRVKEWRRANRQQGKGLRNVKVDTEDDSVSESVYPDFDDDHDPDGGRDPDGSDDDNTRWYEGPVY